MKTHRLSWLRVPLLFVAAWLAATAWAQDFPPDSATPTADEITQRITSTVLDARLKDGTRWRLEYKPNGYFFIDTSTGLRGDGQWTAQDGLLCTQLRGRDASCSAVRLAGGVLHVKRASGEIIQLVARP